ncbi:hypothetical protein JCGZ_23916 [Jatropha curcas]|uniref:Uncharacterized protein n=1 Tax=Jatropha curcas TaxID=180498 RepID=A0A067LFT2_JATCU|nr:hypothetical protein JCGZ_23916 [Jatropha curcas]
MGNEKQDFKTHPKCLSHILCRTQPQSFFIPPVAFVLDRRLRSSRGLQAYKSQSFIYHRRFASPLTTATARTAFFVASFLNISLSCHSQIIEAAEFNGKQSCENCGKGHF